MEASHSLALTLNQIEDAKDEHFSIIRCCESYYVNYTTKSKSNCGPISTVDFTIMEFPSRFVFGMVSLVFQVKTIIAPPPCSMILKHCYAMLFYSKREQ